MNLFNAIGCQKVELDTDWHMLYVHGETWTSSRIWDWYSKNCEEVVILMQGEICWQHKPDRECRWNEDRQLKVL